MDHVLADQLAGMRWVLHWHDAYLLVIILKVQIGDRATSYGITVRTSSLEPCLLLV